MKIGKRLCSMKVGNKVSKLWLLVALLVVAVLASTSAPLVFAQDIPDSLLTVNMTGMNASLLTIGMTGVGDSRLIINTVVVEITDADIYPIICDFGLSRPEDIRLTGTAFTIRNSGETTIDVTIYVTGDWTGGTNWTHSDECMPGVNTAGLRAIVEDSNGHTSVIVKKSEPYNYIVTDLAPGEDCDFALEFYAPTAFGDYTQKTNGIYIEVSEAT